MDKHPQKVLCVDLDGTLIKTDVTFESILAFLKKEPFNIFVLLYLFFLGRARLKRVIAEKVSLDPSLLPYSEDFLAYLKNEKDKGRKLVLATASDIKYARAVAEHLDIFDGVIASEGQTNIKGKAKLKAMEERFGRGNFVYAGNSLADLPIFRGSAAAIVVSPYRKFIELANKHAVIEASFIHRRKGHLGTFLKLIRIHQWVKNLLVFLPAIMAHRIFEPQVLILSLIAFVCFSLCASAVYIFNDLSDLDVDRAHPEKRLRPLASADVTLPTGLIMAPLLLIGSFVLADLFLSGSFVLLLFSYFTLTSFYSLYLKRIFALDIVILAVLYALRVMAGGYATEIIVSTWLIAFSMFFFFSLACIKRFSELHGLRQRSDNGLVSPSAPGRGYRSEDLEQISAFGSSSAYISVLVLALYISGPDVKVLYARPDLIWLLCPLFLYWLSRVWIIAHRGELNEDPIIFAIKDKVSYLTGAIGAIILVLAA
jgi:4-hydroxybenzoate polyprenyltransferase/phosphoserine phosphatase